MKKLYLLLTPALFSGLLVGCGMTGPLYQAPETQAIKQKPATPEKAIKEQKSVIAETTSTLPKEK